MTKQHLLCSTNRNPKEKEGSHLLLYTDNQNTGRIPITLTLPYPSVLFRSHPHPVGHVQLSHKTILQTKGVTENTRISVHMLIDKGENTTKINVMWSSLLESCSKPVSPIPVTGQMILSVRQQDMKRGTKSLQGQNSTVDPAIAGGIQFT